MSCHVCPAEPHFLLKLPILNHKWQLKCSPKYFLHKRRYFWMAKGTAEHMNMKNVHEQVFFFLSRLCSFSVRSWQGKGFLSKAKLLKHFGIRICLQPTEKSLWFIKMWWTPRFLQIKKRQIYLILFKTYLSPTAS